MDVALAKKKIRWYLEEYAKSTSGRSDLVHVHNWSGCEIIGLAANILRRDIYVLAQEETTGKDCSCSLYRASSFTRRSKIIEREEQLVLTADEFYQQSALNKQRAGRPVPLVLRYRNSHYSDFVHLRITLPLFPGGSSFDPAGITRSQSAESDVSMTEDMEDVPDEPKLDTSEGLAVRHYSDHFDHKAAVSPRIHMSELRVHSRQLPIPHSLKPIIDQIFGSHRPERFSALFNFLTATVPELGIVDQQRLASVDMTDITNIEAVQLKQQHHMGTCVLLQWQSLVHEVKGKLLRNDPIEQKPSVREMGDDNRNDTVVAITDQAIHESRAQALITTHAHRSSCPGVSTEQTTLVVVDEKGASRGRLANQHDELVVTYPKKAATATTAIARPELPLLTNGTWQDMWLSLGKTWPAHIRDKFPTLQSTTEKWKRAVSAAMSRLCCCFKIFHTRIPS
uniref:Uncharacterized protein n=1 Tax=Hyaloperonospora arabidopsidis (strain Emoy2) TaxID=559515 RepID=M4BIZ7_HYAAE